jgi:ferric-dicitrate binding protein FerR (iron transport regulator)
MNIEPGIKKIPFVKYYLRIILIILIVIVLIIGLFRLRSYFNNSSNYKLIVTESGESIKTIELADKSIVYLSRNSKLVYRNSFNKSDRELILEGEAYFEVVNTETYPFIVFTDKSSVLVSGTKFNIKEEHDRVVVSVISGGIAFYETDNRDNRLELVSNQSGCFDKKTNEISYCENINH